MAQDNSKQNSQLPATKYEDHTAFKKILSKYGLDKQEYLAKFETYDQTLAQRAVARAYALQQWRQEIRPLVEFYKDYSKKGMPLVEEIAQLEGMIADRIMKKREQDPSYDPLDDKQLVSAMERKDKLIESMQRMQLNIVAMKAAKPEQIQVSEEGVSFKDMMSGGVSHNDSNRNNS